MESWYDLPPLSGIAQPRTQDGSMGSMLMLTMTVMMEIVGDRLFNRHATDGQQTKH